MRGFALPLSSFREMRFRMRILLEWLQLRLVAQTAHAQRDTGTAGDSLSSPLPLKNAFYMCLLILPKAFGELEDKFRIKWLLY